MNFVGLWTRIISIILIMCLLVVLSFVLFKNKIYFKWLIPIALVLVFSFSIFNVFTAIVKPSVQTFVGTYIGFEKEATSINFFSLEYCFEVNNTKKYVSTDIIAANVLCLNGLEIGRTYEVSYESNENIIVEIHEKEESSM